MSRHPRAVAGGGQCVPTRALGWVAGELELAPREAAAGGGMTCSEPTGVLAGHGRGRPGPGSAGAGQAGKQQIPSASGVPEPCRPAGVLGPESPCSRTSRRGEGLVRPLCPSFPPASPPVTAAQPGSVFPGSCPWTVPPLSPSPRPHLQLRALSSGETVLSFGVSVLSPLGSLTSFFFFFGEPDFYATWREA